MNPELEKVLLKVQKPGRYAGGESNRVVKDQEQVDVRFAFCFPDVYEVGMSHLGMKILYGLFNEMDGVWCERVFAPYFRIFAEIIQGEAIPVGGNDAGNREEKGPEKDKEVFYNAQSDYLAGEGKAVKQREKLRTLPLAHCHTVEHEARLQHQGQQGDQNGDKRGQHADAGKRSHQIHSQDQGQIQGGKSLGGDLGFRQGFTGLRL